MRRDVMLRTRQLIPPLTARTPAGQTVRAWDYKQKKNLVIAFLHTACPRCEGFLERVVARAAELAEREALALVVLAEPPAARSEKLPPQVAVAADVGGRSRHAYLGEDAFWTGRAGARRRVCGRPLWRALRPMGREGSRRLAGRWRAAHLARSNPGGLRGVRRLPLASGTLTGPALNEKEKGLLVAEPPSALPHSTPVLSRQDRATPGIRDNLPLCEQTSCQPP